MQPYHHLKIGCIVGTTLQLVDLMFKVSIGQVVLNLNGDIENKVGVLEV